MITKMLLERTNGTFQGCKHFGLVSRRQSATSANLCYRFYSQRFLPARLGSHNALRHKRSLAFPKSQHAK